MQVGWPCDRTGRPRPSVAVPLPTATGRPRVRVVRRHASEVPYRTHPDRPRHDVVVTCSAGRSCRYRDSAHVPNVFYVAFEGPGRQAHAPNQIELVIAALPLWRAED